VSVLKPAADANILRPDRFWDTQSGGGVRCSSEGADGNRYRDPGSAYTEINSRSIASLLPGGSGVRGVIVPRATLWGGSRGFDPHRPRLMNVDPDIKGQASVVDLSQFSKERVAEAYELALEQVGDFGDPRLVASQAFRNLAVGTEPVGMGQDSRRIDADERKAPLTGLDTYVVPKAAPGGGQMPLRPVQPEAMVENVPTSPSVALGPPPKPKTDPASVLAYNRPEDINKMTKAQYRQAAKESSAALMAKLGLQRDPGAMAEEEEQQIIVPNAATPSRQPRIQTPTQPRMEPKLVYQEPALPSPRVPPALTTVPQQPEPGTAGPVFQEQRDSGGGFREQVPVQVQPRFPGAMLQGQLSIQQAPVQQGLPPTTEVLFEIEGWGQIPLAYHKVIRNGLLLVLAWDKRWPTGKSFPPASDKVMAAHVKGTNKVFFVHSTNSTFEDENTEYCILLIAKEVLQESPRA
jgi:hypothetical protein